MEEDSTRGPASMPLKYSAGTCVSHDCHPVRTSQRLPYEGHAQKYNIVNRFWGRIKMYSWFNFFGINNSFFLVIRFYCTKPKQEQTAKAQTVMNFFVCNGAWCYLFCLRPSLDFFSLDWLIFIYICDYSDEAYFAAWGEFTFRFVELISRTRALEGCWARSVSIGSWPTWHAFLQICKVRVS